MQGFLSFKSILGFPVIARSEATWQSPGKIFVTENVVNKGTFWCLPLTCLHCELLRCAWRLPRRPQRPPRNDTVFFHSATNRLPDKLPFILLGRQKKGVRFATHPYQYALRKKVCDYPVSDSPGCPESSMLENTPPRRGGFLFRPKSVARVYGCPNLRSNHIISCSKWCRFRAD